MRKWPLLLITVLVLIVGGRFIYGAMTRKDDKTQIREALAEAIKASEEGRPGGVADKLAENLKVNDMPVDPKQVMNVVKNNHPKVQIADTDPLISGDTAQITSDVSVTFDFMGSQKLDFKDAQIQFKKESAMEWLIFPTSKWHLSAIRVSPDSIPNFPSM